MIVGFTHNALHKILIGVRYSINRLLYIYLDFVVEKRGENLNPVTMYNEDTSIF